MVEAMVPIVMRCLHVGGVAVLVGSLAFVVLCAGPARAWIDRPKDFELLKRIERRWRVLMVAAIVCIVVAGLYNWLASAPLYATAGLPIHVLLGVKVTLAAVLIALLWAQDVGLTIHPDARWWRAVCLILALVVLLLGAVVRYLCLAAITG